MYGINLNGYSGLQPQQIAAIQEIVLAVLANAQMSDIEYDDDGNITSYSLNGNVFTKTYNSEGQLQSVRGMGRTWTYNYDSNGRLAGVE